MAQMFKIALWNANGLSNHKQEMEIFLKHNEIDIMLISETHFSSKHFFKIPNFHMYTTNHPDAERHARGGSAILIRKQIRHYQLPDFKEDFLQATSIMVEDWHGPLAVSAAYCPPNYPTNKEGFISYFRSLGSRFMAGADYNAKHTMWGSRLTPPGRGKVLHNVMQELQLGHLSTYEPTYWPSDPKKKPDLLDFFVTKGIAPGYLTIESCRDLHTDHSPIIATVNASFVVKDPPAKLFNKNTDWNCYRELLDNQLDLT